MKVLRQFCAVSVLTIVLAQAASADGVIHPGIIDPPPPPPPICGVIHPGAADSGEVPKGEDATIDLMTEITLGLVQNLLALL